MTSFVRYYDDQRKLVEISMKDMEVLLKDNGNKSVVADHVFNRLYHRFLKIFEYQDDNKQEYDGAEDAVFNREYKNGFLMMASCALCIETFAAFLNGDNETPAGKSVDGYKKVFQYAEDNNNSLADVKNQAIYKHIRCGLLHQGETTGQFKITREKGNKLFDGDKTINAYLFHKELVQLLRSYRDELVTAEYTGSLWDNCRRKIRYIINNSKN